MGELNKGEVYAKVNPDSPFALIRLCNVSVIEDALRQVKMGQYSRIAFLFAGVAQVVDVETVTVEELESFSGIGPKTARFFVVHTRKNQRHAILDTHILKYLRQNGINAPKSTPSGKAYLTLEQEFLKLADKSGMSLADFDLMLWKSFRKG